MSLNFLFNWQCIFSIVFPWSFPSEFFHLSHRFHLLIPSISIKNCLHLKCKKCTFAKRASYGSFSLKRDIFYAIINQIRASPQTIAQICFHVFCYFFIRAEKRKCNVMCQVQLKWCRFFHVLCFLSSTQFEWQDLFQCTKRWNTYFVVIFIRLVKRFIHFSLF